MLTTGWLVAGLAVRLVCWAVRGKLTDPLLIVGIGISLGLLIANVALIAVLLASGFLAFNDSVICWHLLVGLACGLGFGIFTALRSGRIGRLEFRPSIRSR